MTRRRDSSCDGFRSESSDGLGTGSIWISRSFLRKAVHGDEAKALRRVTQKQSELGLAKNAAADFGQTPIPKRSRDRAPLALILQGHPDSKGG